ncbi:MAG TPA: HDOD domain-containing protein [Polyangiaceae bacterium]|nr:HDOD domain-containing protein [Polyangiaceae bacterium]
MTDLVSAALCHNLLLVFDDPTYRPPALPGVALELMAISGQPDPDLGEVVALLERDAMLAGTVLRLVSSPFYAGRARIRSLREAVVRIGVRGVRDAVFEAALRQGVFAMREYADTAQTVARHSTVTAYVAKLIARRAHLDADTAFLGGLLHDVGYAGLLLAVAHVEGDDAPGLAPMWGDVCSLHPRASRMLAERWGLPWEIAEIAGSHHDSSAASTSRVLAAVRLADHLSESLGAPVLGPLVGGRPLPSVVGNVSVDLPSLMRELCIDEVDLAQILEDAERVIGEIVAL